MKFAVSDDVKRFSAIKKGDDVKLGYYESVAIAIAKPGEARPPTGRTIITSREPGKKPAGTAMTVTDVNVTIEDIDRERREVTLKGPRGNVVKVEVDPEVGNLENIKKGDQLAITYTEALAVSVEKRDRK
jgi:Cu/Ag efflux protein CusF